MSERLVEVRFTVEETEEMMSELEWIIHARPIQTRDRSLQSSYTKLAAAFHQLQVSTADASTADSSHRDDAPPLGWSDV